MDSCEMAKKFFSIALAQENLLEAQKDYQRALATGCSNPKILAGIYNNLGDIEEQLGNLERAVTLYKKAESYLPNNELILSELAKAYDRLGKENLANKYYNRLYVIKSSVPAETIISKLDYHSFLRSIAVRPDTPTHSTYSIQHKDKIQDTSNPIPVLPSVTLYFGFDSHRLRPEAVGQLQELLSAIRSPALERSRFVIEGHTCSLGSESYNMKLSIKRATMVKKWLVSHGVDPSRLLVRGFGETRPRWPNDREETRRLNRRVEIKTVGFVSAATRGGCEPQSVLASTLLVRGQDMIAMGQCSQSIPVLKKALSLFQAANDYLNARLARQSLVLGYSCMGELAKAVAISNE